jgi:hypothetical protein
MRVTTKCFFIIGSIFLFTGISGITQVKAEEAIQLFEKVLTPNNFYYPSKKFKAKKYKQVSIDTTRWDKTPYLITAQKEELVTLKPGQRCFLAGDRAGKKGWKVDNFLLFEIDSPKGIKWVGVGQAETVRYKGVPVNWEGVKKFNFGPQEIELTKYFPKNELVQLKVSALDYGGVGGVSDVYLIIK